MKLCAFRSDLDIVLSFVDNSTQKSATKYLRLILIFVLQLCILYSPSKWKVIQFL